MTQRDIDTRDNGWSVDDREDRRARARLAFDQDLREVSQTGARAARRLLVPALWGAALVGGALLAVAMLRMLRRSERALFRITIEPKFQSRSLLPSLGGTVARLAIQRLLAAPEAQPKIGELPHSAADEPHAARVASGLAGTSNGRANA